MPSLSNALSENSSLRFSVHVGIGALKAADRALIAISERPKIGDSIDLDAATQHEFPQSHRWDYILSVTTSNKLIGLEPHSASDGEVRVVIRKKKNAQDYLRQHLAPQHSVAEWHWVTRGNVGFSRMDRVTRALNQNGIRFAGRSLKGL